MKATNDFFDDLRNEINEDGKLKNPVQEDTNKNNESFLWKIIDNPIALKSLYYFIPSVGSNIGMFPLGISTSSTPEKDYNYEEQIRALNQQLRESQQREKELQIALEEERKRNELEDSVEKHPITTFIDYAMQIPAHQYQRAKVIKEVLGDIFDIRKMDDETYKKWKNIGSNEIQGRNITTTINVGDGGTCQVSEGGINNNLLPK